MKTVNTISKRIKQLTPGIVGAVETGVSRALTIARERIIKQSNFPVVSGRLRESVGNVTKEGVLDVATNSTRVTGSIGSNVEYARRIEYGFHGEDSIHRWYNQQGQFVFTNGFLTGAEDYNKAVRIAINEYLNAARD